MSDITITIPLSWLSFLTWSGFWVVYLYVGLAILLSMKAIGLRNALSEGWRFNTTAKAWADDRRLPLFIALVFLGWPYIVWHTMRRVIEGNQP